MTEQDFAKFRDGLSGVYSFYDKDINDFSLNLWWNALKQFDLNAVIQAFGKHVVNTESGKWLPRPADIIRMLQGSTQDSAMTAWAKVDKAIRHKGSYVDVVFDDPLIHRVINDMGGWIALGQKNDDEWPFVAREFENRYRGFRERNQIPDYPTILTGIANHHNERHGLKKESMVFVGDEKECLKVLQNGNSNNLVKFKEIKDHLTALITEKN